jgi:hypothetical protein
MKILTFPKDRGKTKTAYKITASICKTYGAERVTVYGIEVRRTGKCNGYARIEDISADKRQVEQLLFRLKKGNVSPDQLIYVVEDYLVELTT